MLLNLWNVQSGLCMMAQLQELNHQNLPLPFGGAEMNQSNSIKCSSEFLEVNRADRRFGRIGQFQSFCTSYLRNIDRRFWEPKIVKCLVGNAGCKHRMKLYLLVKFTITFWFIFVYFFVFLLQPGKFALKSVPNSSSLLQGLLKEKKRYTAHFFF